MKKTHFAVLSLGFVAMLAACSQSESGSTDVLQAFEASDCNRELTSSALSLADAGVDGGMSDAGTVTRQCVDYRLSDGGLSVRLQDFYGPCGVKWGGGVALDGKTLVLQSKNTGHGCLVARCGGCKYDFGFVVNGISSERALPLRIEIGECADGSQQREVSVSALTLPIDEHDHGRICDDFGAE